MGARILVLLAVVVVVAAIAAAHRVRRGRLRAVGGSAPAERGTPGLEFLGVPSDRPGLVLVTLPGCATCPAARRVVAEAADALAVWTREVDASAQQEAARALHVLRAPTVLVVGAGHRLLARATGVPVARELRDALAGSPVAA